MTAPPVAGRRPPGPHGYPLVGVLPMARRSPLAYLCEAARRYGDVVSLPLGLHRTYLVSHPDLVRLILQDVHTYQKEPTAARVRALFGGSLTTIDGGRWQMEFLGQFGARIGGGTDQIQRNTIGEKVLRLPPEPRIDKGIPFRDIPR